MSLTVDRVRELSGEDVRRIKALSVSKKDIEHVHDLSPCLDLQRLDLSHNRLTNFKGISDCYALTWVNVSHNQIESLSAIRKLHNLRMLNASHNSLTKCGDLSSLTSLRALVLNNNELTTIPGLRKLTQLNTLVISHNSFEAIDTSALSELTKASFSHNLFRQCPNTQFNYNLSEIRLNGNKMMEAPCCFGNNTKLRVVDLGNNRIRDIRKVETLRELRSLKNLNLKGNPVCDNKDYREKVQEMLPSLEVFDSIKLKIGKAFKAKKTKSKAVAMEKKEDPSLTKHETLPVSIDGPSDTPLDGVLGVKSDQNCVRSDDGADQSGGKETRRKRPRGRSGVVRVESIKKKKISKQEKQSLLVAMETQLAGVGEGGASAWD